MTVAGEIPFNQSKLASRNLGRLISLSYVGFAVVFVLLIWAASTSSGTASGDFASMTAFP
jgi:hypothetical protein